MSFGVKSAHKHSRTKFVMNALLVFGEKIENSSSGALVLHKTSNLIISRGCQEENGKKMYQNEKLKIHSSSGALVLHKTSNVILSRGCQEENGKEMYQNEKRTCSACKTVVFAH